MYKRLTAVLLSILMTLLLLPVTTAEEDTTEQPEPIETVEPAADPKPEPAGEPTARGTNDVQVNIADFDADFWEVLKDIGAASEVNGNYYIDLSVEDIDCPMRNLKSIKGVNLFTNLKRLSAWANDLTAIVLSGLHLEELNVNDNDLTIQALENSGWDKTTIKTLEVAGMGFADISYLNGFTAIETLNCSRSNLTSLDVSGFPTLLKLDCQFNDNLASLKINSGLNDLEMGGTLLNPNNVDFNGATLTVVKLDGIGFDLNALKQYPLITLDLDNYAWGTLDFTPWQDLQDLRCDGSSLTSLNVAGLQHLTRIRANDNELTSLDLTGVTSLNELYISNNRIPELILPNGVALNENNEGFAQTIPGYTATDNGNGTSSFDLDELGIQDFTRVTLTGNTLWTNAGSSHEVTFPTGENATYTYDIGDQGTHQYVMPVTVDFGGGNQGGTQPDPNYIPVDPDDFDAGFLNALIGIGAAKEENGDYYIDENRTEIDCGFRSLTSLKGIERFTNLERLNCQDNNLDAIDVSMMPSLKVLDCHSNPLTGTIRFHENLEELECWLSQIDGNRIAIPQNSSLKVFKIDSLQTPDLSFLYGLPLETLDCPYIDFGTLDFTHWPTLHDLRCDSCNLTGLNVSGLSNLTRIRANDNNLTSLDLTGLTALEELYLSDNCLAELILPNGIVLDSFEIADQHLEDYEVLPAAAGHFTFDLSKLVTQLQNVSALWATDANGDSVNVTINGSGVLTFDAAPGAFGYTYATGADPLDVAFTNVSAGPAFKTESLILSGQIGVNFFMDLSALTPQERQDSYMEFSVNGRTKRADFDPDFTNPDRGVYYGFTCSISSVEMADTITATFCYRNGRTQQMQYSAQEYLNSATSQYANDQTTLEAIQSVADYGHYVQAFLEQVNGSDEGHQPIDPATQLGEAEINDAKTATEANEIKREPAKGSFIEKTPFSLSVNDLITINLYVNTEEGHALLSAKLGENAEEDLQIELRPNGQYRVRIAGIKASELGDTFKITLNAGGADTVVEVSALSYVRAVLTEEEYASNTAARQAVTAIYLYYQKTQAYLNAQNQSNS